ncbi:hypothetical protein Hanom_Chr15g01376771 [Helianthus anomalus]
MGRFSRRACSANNRGPAGVGLDNSRDWDYLSKSNDVVLVISFFVCIVFFLFFNGKLNTRLLYITKSLKPRR